MWYHPIYYVIGERNKDYPLKVRSFVWAIRLALEIKADIHGPHEELLATYEEIDDAVNS